MLHHTPLINMYYLMRAMKTFHAQNPALFCVSFSYQFWVFSRNRLFELGSSNKIVICRVYLCVVNPLTCLWTVLIFEFNYYSKKEKGERETGWVRDTSSEWVKEREIRQIICNFCKVSVVSFLPISDWLFVLLLYGGWDCLGDGSDDSTGPAVEGSLTGRSSHPYLAPFRLVSMINFLLFIVLLSNFL